MNNPEVTMHQNQQPNRFDALDKAISALQSRNGRVGTDVPS